MNRNLEELIKAYAAKGNAEAHLLGMSLITLKSILIDLLTMYFNDLNSSTLREIVVALVSGYELRTEKLGYNGYRHNALTGKTEYCEIKPVNIRTDTEGNAKRKLNGGGNFTDYTWARLAKNIEDNPTMLVAGFVDGQLIYVLSFEFSEPSFVKNLEEKLEKRFPGQTDLPNEYLRSASFSYEHFKDSASLKMQCYVTKERLNQFKGLITSGLINDLLTKGGGGGSVISVFNKLILGDTLPVLRKMDDGIVDVGITSPPYNKQEKHKGWLVKNVVYDAYTDAVPEEAYQKNQVEVLNEIYRITKPEGSFFYNHKVRWERGDMIHPMDWLRRTKWTIKQEIIWDRVIAANIRGWRFWQVEERVYWLYKPANGYKIGAELRSQDAKLTSIWRSVPENSNPHPAPFPLWLPARVIISILGMENKGVVLDPYMGGGTTAVAAKLLGHEYVGVDRSEAYLNYARERLRNADSEMRKIQEEIALHAVGDTFSDRKTKGMNIGRFGPGKDDQRNARLL